MARPAPSEFAEFLRRRRFELSLSQETLAERAGISIDAVSRYERGLTSVPRRETIALLVVALELSGDEKTKFEAAAKRKYGAISVACDSLAHNLPWQATSFVGRRSEVEEISELLAPRRLVTIAGAGGIGKTRTAVEIATRLLSRSSGETRFIDLAPLTDGALLLSRLASVLDVQVSKEADLIEALVATTRFHTLLLVLDNCEHVIDAIRSLVVGILNGCPNVALLATSRERLRVGGEVVFPLSPLSVPSEEVTTAAECRAYDALDLFAERAATSKRGFSFSDEHVEAVVEICRKLDGIALAIELAAARLPVLGLPELRAQLAKNFRVIAGGRRDHPARHETLHATISWSHDLLDESERLLFRRLAIFSGGWTLEAAETACWDDKLPRDIVLDTLLALVDKSLVAADVDSTTPRYSLFDSTRAFALDRLVDSGESERLFRRHAEWVVAFADRADEMFTATSRMRWELSVLPEIDNAFAALDWALGPGGDDIIAGRITGRLRVCLQYPGFSVRGRSYIDRVLARIDAEEHPELVARLLIAQGMFRQGIELVDILKRAIQLLGPCGDRRLLIVAYCNLSYALSHAGDYVAALAANDMAHELVLAGGFQQTLLHQRQLFARSTVFQLQGRIHDARALAVEMLDLATIMGDINVIVTSQSVLAELEFASGNAREAVRLLEEALASAHRARGADQVYLFCNLAAYQLCLGDLDAAAESARRVLRHTHASTELVIQAAIQHLAAVAALRGDPRDAARLLGCVDTCYERYGVSRDPTDQKGHDVLMESLRRRLSETEIRSLAEQGATFTTEEAVVAALALS